MRSCHTSAAGIKELLNPFPVSLSRAEFPGSISLTSSATALFNENDVAAINGKENEGVLETKTVEKNEQEEATEEAEVEVEVGSIKDPESELDMPEIDIKQQYRNGHIPFEFEKNQKGVVDEGGRDEEGEGEGEDGMDHNIAVGAGVDIGRESRDDRGGEVVREFVAGLRERAAGPLTADSFYLDMFKTMCDSVDIGTCCLYGCGGFVAVLSRHECALFVQVFLVC